MRMTLSSSILSRIDRTAVYDRAAAVILIKSLLTPRIEFNVGHGPVQLADALE